MNGQRATSSTDNNCNNFDKSLRDSGETGVVSRSRTGKMKIKKMTNLLDDNMRPRVNTSDFNVSR